LAEANPKGCRDLEVYKLAHALGIRIHAMSLRLPHFELFEEGCQVRRSAKSVASQIVEGCRLRQYRDEFLHYLHRAAGSADETREHLDNLRETGSLKDESLYLFLRSENEKLLSKLNQFIIGVERNHSKPYYLRV